MIKVNDATYTWKPGDVFWCFISPGHIHKYQIETIKYELYFSNHSCEIKLNIATASYGRMQFNVDEIFESFNDALKAIEEVDNVK